MGSSWVSHHTAMAGLLLALLALVSTATAIEPWTLGDLGGSGFASKIYDDLDTDVSIASRPEHSPRSNVQKQEQALPHWEAADLTRRYQEEQKLKTHRCRNFMGREVPCSGPPHLIHPGQIHQGLQTVGLGSQQPKMCETPGCIGVSHMLLENMDQSVSPCDDFYQFVCGGFEERVAIPDDRSSWSQFSVIDKELQQQLRALLESPPPPAEAPVFKKVRSVYHACMNEPLIEEIGLQPLKDKLRSMGGWPVLEGNDWQEDEFSWIETTYKFRENSYSTDLLIDFSIGTDIKNSSWRVIDIDQASLGQAQTYLVKGLSDRTVSAYYKYMVNVAVLLGAERSVAERELKDSIEFEMELARASMPREMRRDSNRMYNPMMIRDLNEYAPMVPWLEYINKILTPEILVVKDTERVILDEPGYLRNLTEILKRTPKRTIANYMFFRAASSSLGFFTKAARKVQEDYSQELTGTTSTTPRWKQCVGTASGIFSSVVGHLYVKKHFKEEAKRAMDEMVRDIRGEMDVILKNIQWMDDKTRVRAREKLRTMREYIGYPDELLQVHLLEEVYKDLEVSPLKHFENGIEVGKWSTTYVWSKIREKIDKTDWKRHDQPAIVNAFYSPLENSIQFPAGILQGNFFGADRPAYMNYGAIGWVIGHEITHGFDDQGRTFDSTGNLANWWERSTEENYLEKAQCIIWQYGNYTARPPVSINLNGINTQGENIADNGGIKEAYNAYQSWTKRNGAEPRLPGFAEYTPEQMFWISAGNTWCSKYRPLALERRIRTGAHSPGPFRVKGPFSNSPDFSRDFHCPIGSTMNPTSKCEVW